MAASLCRKTFLHYKNSIFKLQCRTQYIVLIPEAPEDVEQYEIFSRTGHLVEFDKVTPKECRNLMVRKSQMYDVGAWELGEQIKIKLQNNEKIDVFKNMLGPLEVLYVPFISTWGLVNTLYHANRDLMPARTYHMLRLKATELRMEKFNMQPIYEACKKFLEEDGDKFTTEEKRVLQKYVWEGKVNGLGMNEKNKTLYAYLNDHINMRIKEYNQKYVNSVLQFSQVYSNPEVINDFPPDLLRYSALDVEEPEKGPWVISLRNRIYSRFMEYCPLRQARLQIWLTKRQICSKHGQQRFRADLEVEDLREKRAEYANLLGYPTFAHLAVENQMAGTLENIHDMLEVLLEKAKLGQEMEVDELEKFAQSKNFMGQIELWDLAYWSRLQKKELYNFDEIALQEYFPLSQVLLGLFALCEQLFGIVIEEDKNATTWSSDSRYFRVMDEKTKADLGGFYFDPYARKTKVLNDGPMCIVMNVASKICNTLPSVSLIFDFARPTEDKPSLLLFKEVEELFTQFGLALQHILSGTEHSEVCSFAYIESDAQEICGKFLRHWLFERGTLESVSGHYNTGEPIPAHIAEGICQMEHHMAGTKLSKEIYLSHLDLQLSIDNECCMPIVERLWPEHFLFDLLDKDHHPFGMKDIVLGTKACQYYGNVWSDVIAADAFHAFKEAGFRNQEEVSLLGRRFRSTYFALGGGCSASEIFKRFRGRDPSPMPYLAQVGLKDLTPNLTPSTEPSQIASN